MKKKNSKANTNTDVEKETKVKLPKYAPNVGITPVEYRLAEQFAGLESSFEAFCQAFLSKANPDMENGNYLDALIAMVTAEALRDLERQRAEHLKLCRNDLEQMHKQDRVFLEVRLNDCLDDRDELQRKLQVLRRILYRGTSYEYLYED